ncbi:uncharacterized protein LOC124270339 [Haliotis rubra]|uniref:uncharacterized protein LOC124270339 n=1 Tax=Haliotis rubra TaxID=36100 RepID=UPI001EE5553A|nr:uncharacterized protein LOC124270339 [Haliotis rubra]
MAGTVMMMLLSILLASLTLPQVSGTSQLYDKIRTLMKNEDFQRTVAEVKRDMDAEEAERELKENKEERLLTQLRTLLSPDDADDDEPSEREYDDDSPYRRLVDFLQKRDSKDEDWFDTKPPLSTIADDCYLRNHYQTLWPKDCNYYLKKKDEGCLGFCNNWLSKLKEKYSLPDDCRFDNKYSGSSCESKIGEGAKKDCSICSRGYFYPNCCGSCKRSKCV